MDCTPELLGYFLLGCYRNHVSRWTTSPCSTGANRLGLLMGPSRECSRIEKMYHSLMTHSSDLGLLRLGCVGTLPWWD